MICDELDMSRLKRGVATLSTQQRAADEIDRLRAELTEARRQLKGAKVPRTTEHHIALREAHQIHDSNAYFDARSELLDSGHNRHIFNAGYVRGFDAGEKIYAAPVPHPADDFRTRLIALCQQWTPANLDRIESCEEIIREVAESPHSQPAVPEAVAKDAIPAGWVFYSADASIQYNDPRRPMSVMIKRDVAGVKWWLQLTEEEKKRTPLYSSGAGMTLTLAIQNACTAILSATDSEVKKDV